MIARIVFKRPIKASEIGNIYTVCEKKIQQRDSWDIRSVEINSLVHPVKSRKHW